MDRPDDSRRRVRRRIVVLAVLATGTAISAWALRIPAGDRSFVVATAVLAAVWLVGARMSGPITLGHAPYRPGVRPVLSSIAVAAALVVLFCLGAVLVAPFEVLRAPVLELLDHAGADNLLAVAVLTAVNGVAEECFHRGALYQAVNPSKPVLVSTVVYGAVAATSGVPLLALAAVLLGLVTGAQRRCTGGVLGPICTHVTWSMAMLLLLGPILQGVG